MLRTVDRYVIREVIPPFVIVLVVFTFMLLMQPIMKVADDLIAKGVSWHILLRVMPTLLPSALALTIPAFVLLAGLPAIRAGALHGLRVLGARGAWFAWMRGGSDCWTVGFGELLGGVVGAQAHVNG